LKDIPTEIVPGFLGPGDFVYALATGVAAFAGAVA